MRGILWAHAHLRLTRNAYKQQKVYVLHQYGTYLTPSTFHDRTLPDPGYNGFSSPVSSESHLVRTIQGLWLRQLVARELVCYQVLTFPRPGDIGEHVDEEEAR